MSDSWIFFFCSQPNKITVNGGGIYTFEHDMVGALSSITTPKGYKYLFQIQPSVLHNRFIFSPPVSPRHYYQILYNDEGHILATILPQQMGRVVYNYNDAGRLQYQIYGDGSIELGYHSDTGLLRSVTVRELGYEQRIENKYHAGLIKEQEFRFGPAVGMHSSKVRYLYDGHARPRRTEMEINGVTIPKYETSYDITYGTLESVQDLKFTKIDHNKTILQDPRKSYFRVSTFDAYGRKVESLLSIVGRVVHRSKFVYDSRYRLSAHSVWRGPGSIEISYNYTYTPMGYLQGVDGPNSYQYRYDDNGNMISYVENGNSVTATYDEADRLVRWGDTPLNVYDTAGRVIQQNNVQFSFTSRGNARYAWRSGEFMVTYRHDHLGRLVGWQDGNGSVTQFFYTNQRKPMQLTHVHRPASDETTLLLYDENDHLLAIQNGRTKMWVVTDNVGTPMMVYDSSGNVVKEIIRTPWGQIIEDSRPNLKLYVDFHGGIRDPMTKMIIFGLHMYDPVHGQWISPRYDRVTDSTTDPSAIYLNRFSNNNPVNTEHNVGDYPTSEYIKLML